MRAQSPYNTSRRPFVSIRRYPSMNHQAFGFPQRGFFQQPPFFNPFFFPKRRFLPFFFVSPFFFPYVRGEEGEEHSVKLFAQHHCQAGDTMPSLAKAYNVPQPILEAVNPHLPASNEIVPGSVVNIPRMDTMFCYKMYLEHEARPLPAAASPALSPSTAPQAAKSSAESKMEDPNQRFPRYTFPAIPYSGFYSC